MSVKQISVFLENRPGTLNEMTKILADNKIDMRALSVSETKDFGIARLIVDDVLGTVAVGKSSRMNLLDRDFRLVGTVE